MARNSSPDYKALFLQEREARKRAEDQVKRTTFVELLRHCHELLSRPLQVGSLSSLTTGTIPLPKGKYCPTRLEQWVDCAAQQQDIYDSVRRYLQPEENPPRIFPSRERLEGHLISFPQLITSETNVQLYERIAVDSYVGAVIMELCKIPAARKEFGLGDGVFFDSHRNALNENRTVETDTNNHRTPPVAGRTIDGRTTTLLTTVEYKPPHKLTLEDLRAGLCDMDLWKTMVRANKVLNNEADQYRAQRLVCSAIVQEYHVMIREGLEYSYLTTGIALVLLWVPLEKPSTLYYHLCVPNQEVDGRDGDLSQPNTSIARVLCLCLMSFRSKQRDQEWRNVYCSDLHIWRTNFDHTHANASDRTHANAPTEELPQNPPSDITDYVSPESAPTSSEYEKSSCPIESPTAPARRIKTRSQGNCARLDPKDRMGSPDSSGSESDPAASAQDPAAAARKRGYSQVEHSPSQRSSRQNENDRQNDISQRRNAQFCTQRCLLGLQTGGPLDDCCPNVDLHRQGGNGTQHSISAVELISLLKQQMDEDIDRCIPFGSCGSYGAPFKLTCSPHGYTVVGKGTTKNLWTKAVSHEADIYHILRKAQGSAVPVFLGKIDLVKIYFRYGVEIRHMLVMGWAGESTAKLEQTSDLRRETKRSNKEIRSLGVRHLDLRPDNILWNAELGRALIIDFHRSELDRRRTADRSRSSKRSRHKAEISESKRVRVT
ncbi:uncharacterized protein N7515_007242 [Penicillium bovifimosum]|uniref:Protein kinase domain-containing protein n=1 Tax=Penicillium bovifimosum TaxID=126998 RepID=A0A9W9GWF9_9EURO|nr:uncharacterized protein N7515_007242 [Penicillium bovifimosum]KAJ5131203.1 hypothetical protein N7515_007242 [Penicillium bovifimosum]